MRHRQQVPDPLRSLARLQDGVVSREQVRGTGLSDHVIARLVRDGTWSALAAGIYLTAPEPASWAGLAWGGLLAGGPDARLGPSSSGFLHDVLLEPPPVVDVLVPRNGRYRTSGPWQFVREGPGVRSAGSVGAPPRLCVEDTVIDLAATATPREVVTLVTRAVQLRRTRAPRLLVALERRSRHPQRRLLEQLLGDVGEGAESHLELTYLREVERAHDLPRGRRQASRRGLPYATDVGYDSWLVLVELDGRLGHEGEGRFRDLHRDNRFAVEGLVTLRYGWTDVLDRPCEVAAQVAAVLVSRGWSGIPKSCPRCRGAVDLWVAA